MKSELKQNIIYSAIEKLGIIIAQFFTSIILSKFLIREDFGALAVIAGSFAFIQLVNLSLENNLYKEHQKLNSENINSIFGQLMTFNLIKVGVLLVFSIIIGQYYLHKTENVNFLYLTGSYFLVTSMDILVAPFITLSTIKFKQKIATNVSLVRWTINLILASLLIKYPYVEILLIKDVLIFISILITWIVLANKYFNIKVSIIKIEKSFISNYFVGYSLWTHLTSAASTLIYKADALILFYFVSLKTIGNYNIALTLANVASIIPSILTGQNNVALSNTENQDQSIYITQTFLIVSILVGILSFIGFAALGLPYIYMVSKENQFEIYQYLLLIVSGVVLVKAIVSPLVSFINIKGDVEKLFYRVSLPILIFSITTYCFGAFSKGAIGVAVANLINGVFWLFLINLEVKKYNFKFPAIHSFKNEIEKLVIYAKKYNN